MQQREKYSEGMEFLSFHSFLSFEKQLKHSCISFQKKTILMATRKNNKAERCCVLQIYFILEKDNHTCVMSVLLRS